MAFKNTFIPYGGYWSTPFCAWQKSFQNLHAVKFAAEIGSRFLKEKKISPKEFDELIFGITIPQTSIFYGTPWLAGMLGAENITGPMIGQACATGARGVELAALAIESGLRKNIFVVYADRCSNGPLLVYPNPEAPGATQDKESWVWDNFGNDPFAKNAMVETAENVAKEIGISREDQDKITLLRYQQYIDSTKNNRAFQKKYMISPVEVKDRKGRKVISTVDGDEGIFPTTTEGLSKLRPVIPNGTVTFGTQTHPADGNCGIIVTNREKAKELSKNKKIEIQVLSYGEGRAKKGYMAKAIIPAAKMALKQANLSIKDISAIKTHNPFAVNDIYFCREMDIDWKDMNNYGSSLIYGHPQAPTGARLIIELIEELVEKDGGLGLFDGCAAGDTGAAIVIKVSIE
ncbi:MAG: acetyl-CoA acetyltransferase [Thermoplasmatales archaeon SG8-52-3]|nr:MAG: acetyl-CoA acetyltransferase [Thermoplasmatales archaeon SG8-52-3]